MDYQISGGRANVSGTELPEEQKPISAFEALDSELEWLERTVNELGNRLAPVLAQYATAETAGPRPEPASQLRGRVARLADLRMALQEILSRIDL